MSRMDSATIRVVQHGRPVLVKPLNLTGHPAVNKTLDMLSIEVNAALTAAEKAGAEHGYCDVELVDADGIIVDDEVMII